MKRRNPTSDDLYQKFHGRRASKSTVIEVNEADYGSHPDLAKLGDLLSLTVGVDVKLTGKHLNQPEAMEEDAWCVEIKFDPQRPVAVAAEPDGKQLFFVKGDQDISRYLDKFPVDRGKELLDLGPCIRLEYFTEKGFDHFQPTAYFHATGEESGEYPGDNGFNPTLLFNRIRRKLYLVGGVYHVEPDGIVD
jgi:hypothetical protein